MNLRESIRRSEYRTQEQFAFATGINEGLISKYCRGLRKLSKNHKKLIDEFLKKEDGKNDFIIQK